MIPEPAQQVLDFWFCPEGTPEHNKTRAAWFRKDDAFDAEIRTRFSGLIEEAIAGRLIEWNKCTKGTLAHIIVLDQFPRNAFRGQAKSFAGDAQALATARELVISGADRALKGVERQFVYLPFEHAEDLAAQEECLRLFRRLAIDEPELAGLVGWAERHQAIIARFGRFPHRNKILGRQSTLTETQFLSEPGSSF